MKSPIETYFDGLEWQAVAPPDNPEGLPYPTHAGSFHIGDCLIECYVLNTGQRIITEQSLNRLFGEAE